MLAVLEVFKDVRLYVRISDFGRSFPACKIYIHEILLVRSQYPLLSVYHKNPLPEFIQPVESICPTVGRMIGIGRLGI